MATTAELSGLQDDFADRTMAIFVYAFGFSINGFTSHREAFFEHLVDKAFFVEFQTHLERGVTRSAKGYPERDVSGMSPFHFGWKKFRAVVDYGENFSSQSVLQYDHGVFKFGCWC